MAGPLSARRRRMFPVVNPAPAGERDRREDAPAPGTTLPTQPGPPLGRETRPNGRVRNTVARDNSADVPGTYTGRVSRVPRPVRVVTERMLPSQPTAATVVRSPARRDDGLPSCGGSS